MLATASLELKAEKKSAHSDRVNSVAFSTDGATIVSGSVDKTIKVWDAGTLARHIPHPAHKAKCPHACYSFPGAQGREAESAQPHCGLRGLFPRWLNHRVWLRRQDDQSLGCRYLSSPDSSPSPTLSTPTLATASLELKAEKQSAHSRNINSVAFSPDGSTIVSCSDDKTIKVWDAGTLAHHIPHPAQS
jgi:hypothetical protein